MMGSFGLLALALAAVPVQESTDFERFKLFNNCEPMGLFVVFSIVEGATDLKLTEERVQFAVESRLRSARLFKAEAGLPILQVAVDVVGQAFVIDFGYNKELFDPASGSFGYAPVWSNSTGGTYGQNGADFIVSNLLELLDKFLTEYLRANESACTGSPQPPTQ